MTTASTTLTNANISGTDMYISVNLACLLGEQPATELSGIVPCRIQTVALHTARSACGGTQEIQEQAIDGLRLLLVDEVAAAFDRLHPPPPYPPAPPAEPPHPRRG